MPINYAPFLDYLLTFYITVYKKKYYKICFFQVENCRHIALLAVQYYPGITWTPAAESSAGTLLYWQCSTIRGLPGLQQLKALPAHCSTGSVVLSGDYLDSSSWKLCRHTALLAVQYSRWITWTPAVTSSAGTLLYWQCSTLRGLPGLQQLDALPAHCSTGGMAETAGQVPCTIQTLTLFLAYSITNITKLY